MKTPTLAVLFTFGTVYRSVRVDQKNLSTFTKSIIDQSNQTRKCLGALGKLNIMWQALTSYGKLWQAMASK